MRTPLELLTTLLDSAPFAPARLADRALDAHAERAERAAAADPRWAEIQSRRINPGNDSIVFLSDDLCMADWEEQQSISHRLTPDPWWRPVAIRARQLSAMTALGHFRHALQRLVRGWDDREIWSLDHSLCKRLAEQLEHLADNAHGWPGEQNGYPTPESWSEELYAQARALRGYVNSVEYDEALDRWHALYLIRGREEEEEQARAEMDAIEMSNTAAAKTALRWVADHLEMLWD